MGEALLEYWLWLCTWPHLRGPCPVEVVSTLPSPSKPIGPKERAKARADGLPDAASVHPPAPAPPPEIAELHWREGRGIDV